MHQLVCASSFEIARLFHNSWSLLADKLKRKERTENFGSYFIQNNLKNIWLLLRLRITSLKSKWLEIQVVQQQRYTKCATELDEFLFATKNAVESRTFVGVVRARMCLCTLPLYNASHIRRWRSSVSIFYFTYIYIFCCILSISHIFFSVAATLSFCCFLSMQCHVIFLTPSTISMVKPIFPMLIPHGLSILIYGPVSTYQINVRVSIVNDPEWGRERETLHWDHFWTIFPHFYRNYFWLFGTSSKSMQR